MTTKTGTPKGSDQVAEANTGEPGSEDGKPKSVMQTDNLNGGVNETGKAVIGTDIQGHLGRRLKASYDELVRQPVPDKFRQLLEELERREKKE